MEKFLKKSWRSKLALAVTAGILASGYMPQAFAATYSGNSNVIWGRSSLDSKTFGSKLSVGTDGSLVYDFGEDVTFVNSNIGQPKAVINNADVPGAVVIKNNFNAIMHSNDWSAIAVKAGWMEGIYDLPVDKRGSVTFEGDLTMRDKSVKGEWGVTAANIHGGFSTYGGSRWQPAGVRAGLMGDVIINGNLDLAVKGSALVTDPYYKALKADGSGYADDYKLATITTNGNVNIDTPEDMTEAFYAIANYGGTVNVNADATAARDKTVVINGNILTMRDGKGGDFFYRSGQTNIGLTNEKSSWTGVVDNTGASQAGEVNMWLQNNAAWNHKALSLTNGISLGEVPQDSAPHYGTYDGVSHINKLSGGSSKENAGLIFQDDAAAIDINNYSGYTTVFYKHNNDGSANSDYTAGDVIIRNAAKDSVINMVTDSKNINTKDNTKVNSVLNALAGKLTYSDYEKNPENLEGNVNIAGGLTQDSVIIKTGKIQFGDNGKGSYSVPPVTDFKTTLTGDADKDAEYADAGIIQSDGTYKFVGDSTINVSGVGAIGAKLEKGTNIDASGNTLTINVTDASNTNGGVFQQDNIDSTIKADKLVIKLDSSNSGQGAHAIHQNDGTLTIDGDVDIDVKGDNSTVGVYSHAGNTTINGDVKVRLDGNHGGFGEYGAAGIYATAGYGGATGGTINVNGNVDISGVGNGLLVNLGGAMINVDGGKINIVDDKSNGYSAIYATCGKINMNTVKDADGKVIGAGNNDVDITGNVVVSTGGVNYVDLPGLETEVNLGLTTKDSKLTGVIYNAFPEGGKVISDRTFTGESNLWLQNGATWTNEQQGTLPYAYGGESFNGSHVTNFVGGTSAESAGNIYQKDGNALTIDNYSGNTNIFYDHAGDGVTYNAGDTIIKHAEKGSEVNLITSSKGLTINAETINNTLNALAGKLTYSNYADGERNLDGKVKIAGGLTSDSVTMAVGDILFSEDTGKGSGAGNLQVSAPEKQVTNEFNSTLTGNTDKDLEYVLGGVVKDGSYKFTEDSSINVSGVGAIGAKLEKGTNIDASGKTLTINVTDASNTNGGVFQQDNIDSTIKADKLVIKLDSKNSGQGAHAIHQNDGTLTIDGDVDIDVKGDNSTVGVYSHAGNTTINGDVKVRLDGHNGGWFEYGAAGIYAHAGYNGAVGGTIDINGNVDIEGNGNGLLANMGGAVINVKGGRINIVDNSSNGYSAIDAVGGKINMNVVKDADGRVTGADNNDVDITGNVVVSVGAVNYVDDPALETEVNLGLTTKESKLTGVIYNEFPEGGKVESKWGQPDKTFTGAANLWLQNGATWTNEQQGNLPSAYGGEQFNGSHVTNFVGGTSAESAGNIYQKDGNVLTIDKYSGNTNIFYDHAGDGVTYNAGDTIIKHAEKGSEVNLITSSKGLTINAETINNTLNALAGKLTYSNYATGERNLDGKVKIAGGLTSDSVTMAVGDILFSEDTGKGTGAEHIAIPSAPEDQVSTNFNSTLTGDADKDLEYVLGGVVKDGSYKFTEDSSINVSGVGAIGAKLEKGTNIDASGKTLTINVTDASNTNGGVFQQDNIDSTIKADKLVIKLDSKNSGQGAHAIHQNDGTLTIDGDVDIDVKGDNSTVGVYSHAGNTTINGDVKVRLDGHNGGWFEYGAAGIYAHAGYNGAVGGTIDINGNVDIEGNGNGLLANMGGAVINVKGGRINIVDNSSNGYSAIDAVGGKINMNVVKDADGRVTGADNNDVDITGNVVVSVGAVNYVDDPALETEVNLGLTTKESKLTGVIYNEFPEGGKVESKWGQPDKTFTGAANLWLQNGATWTNEQQGNLPSAYGGEQFNGSHVTNFVGGKSAESAGNIYQKDGNALTIDNYSGVTNIFYAHENDGSQESDYAKYGDTIIKHAAEGSVVNMVTNGNGQMDGTAIANILSSLAGKLTYSGYVDGERNLAGSAIIAGGLTSNSVKWALKDIVFDDTTGKGGVNQDTPVEFPDAPKDQEATDFNSGLTGDTNLEYAFGGVVQEDGSYKFTESTNINVKDESAVSDAKDINVDASGKTLTLNVTGDSGNTMAIAQANGNVINIKADKLVINSEANGGYNTKGIAAKQADKDNKAVMNIDADSFIKVEGANGAMGAYIEGNAELNLNGETNIEVKGNVSNSPDYGYYSSSGLRANSSYGIQQGAVINANGNVNIKGDGVGVFANGGGSTINLNSGVNIEATSDYMAAIVAQSGVVNVNMNKGDKELSGNTVTIKGNLVAGAGSVSSFEPFKESVINVTLDNSNSYLHGLAYNQFPADGIDTGRSLRTMSAENNNFTGEINLNLSNGAKWINEQQGALPNPYTSVGGQAFTGSRITNLNGGTGANDVGYIYQKDANDLTIENLSGRINVTYDHTINEDEEIVYGAGNTVINNAAEGSQVTMATSADGINTGDKQSVENAFNGLAKKLIYSDADANPNNLQANMQIGGGLTSDYVSWKGAIEWDGEQGSYKIGSAEQNIKLLYDEDVVSKDTRAAIMSSMVGWRNAAADTYNYRAMARDLEAGANEGVWARTWGGQNKYSGNNTSFKSSYWAGQVGYDKNFANGWNVGVAFDYMTGDDSYNSGSGDTKTYTLGFYGTKEMAENEFLDLTAKVGRMSNDFETKDILGRTVKGNYKATGFSLSGQYSKRFGDESTGYIEPQAQLTIGRLGGSDFDSTGTLEGHISQDAFTSVVGRLGLEAGQNSDHGRYFARLSLSHEFAGSMNTHFSDSSASMTREFDIDGTWCDLTLGGSYNLSKCANFYADITKTLNGDYKQDWKLNAGVRFTF